MNNKPNFCSNCGKPLTINTSGHCIHCGAKIFSIEKTSSDTAENDDETKIVGNMEQSTAVDNDDSTKIVGYTSTTRIVDDNDNTKMVVDNVLPADTTDKPSPAHSTYHNDEPHPKKNIWMWLTPLIVLVVLGGCGAYYMLTTKDHKLASDNEISETEVLENNSDADEIVVIDDASDNALITPDFTFFNVHGRVKSITFSDGATIQFDALGNYIPENGISIERDAKGYITTLNNSKDNLNETYNIVSGKYVKATNIRNDDFTVINEYTFDSNNLMSKCIATTPDYPDQRMVYTFSGYEFDRLGNWISRKVLLRYYYYDENLQEQCDSKDTTQTRTITYYN